MKLITKKLILKTGFSLMLLFFLSCTNEELEKPTTVSVVKQLQSNLKLEQFTNKNLEVNWENIKKTEKDSTEIYQLNVNEKIKSEMVSDFLQKEVQYELIAVKSKGQLYSYLIEAFSNLNYETFPSNIQNLNKFAGTLIVYELNGTKMGQLVVIEGKALNPQKNNALEPLEMTINAFYKSNNLTRRVPACGEVISVYENIEVWTHRYSIATLASTGQILYVRDLGEKLTSSSSTQFSYVYECGTSGQQIPLSATLHQIKTEVYETNIIDDVIYPPSCESFNFTTKAGSLWQEAAVNNIHFNIVVINPDGYYFSQKIWYTSAILFGTPTNITVGNTNISAGLAATLSAKAIDTSIRETVQLYGNKPVSELTVRLYFEERLKYNYPLFIPGGRVNFNASGFSGTPTSYKTNAFGTGNCN